MAGDFAIVTLVMSISSLATGVVSSLVGVREAITIFAGAAALSGCLYLTLTRRLRSSIANKSPDSYVRISA